ncbi:hypothetical protein ATX69_09610 [Oenococcus oeni]|uniref:glycoside hydrolase family 113 n=4 Tax=Oenococcus oeni TaxID=1247 RepID=UPI0008F83AD1|nr:hypothetical protein [Oenococcus oeni]OIK78487.1 hypothetical protein ATW73_09765 [Oenococcus oeni]OIM32241.1 hypothetical protein ATX69_09610 [Oenococcus oeni]
MVYNQREWLAREIVSSDALNNIENGIGDNDKRISATADTVNQLISSGVQSVNNGFKYLTMSVTTGGNSSNQNNFDANINRSKYNLMDYTLVVMNNISGNTTSDFSMPDSSVITYAISRAQENNHKVLMLKPHFGTNWSDGFQRYNYVPDSSDDFFTNWGALLMSYAKICDDNNIPILCLSCETVYLFDDKFISKWSDIVNAIRKSYPKLLLTVAHNAFQKKTTWKIFSLLDYIGINWYPSYTDKVINSIADIPDDITMTKFALQNVYSYGTSDFTNDINVFSQLSAIYNKPIMFTEIGVAPRLGGLATLQPSDLADSSVTDQYDIVAAAMRVILTYFSSVENVIGIAWWCAGKPFNYAPVATTDTGISNFTSAENDWNRLSEKYYWGNR